MPGLCFVVMGFGKKTDYSDTPRTLDLDATYEAIIKPAVLACDLECVRADGLVHSGFIDKKMYELLYQADLVIADISTANPNALYELGVRHALRPSATILIKEVDGKFPFDLNHLATLHYKHLGEDIGAREARDKSAALEKEIRAVLAKREIDSPVYTFLNGLQKPTLDGPQSIRSPQPAVPSTGTFAYEVAAGRQAMASSLHGDARHHFERALNMQRSAQAEGRPEGTKESPADPFLVQQLALATYKSALPDPVSALKTAWAILEPLAPAVSMDLETLGIAGAIRKRLWDREKQREDLEAAIEYYGRGFEIKRDYYNGENYAACLEQRAAVQTDAGEADYDRRTAHKVRERIVTSLRAAFAQPTTRERPDYRWMLATMANCLYALDRREDAAAYEAQFRSLKETPAAWEIATFDDGKARALSLAARRVTP